jgi:hypothetical protein
VTTCHDSICYHVRLSVPRRGGWRAWLPVSGRFEQRLAEQPGSVIGASVESETRRGRDFIRVSVVITLAARDVAEALDGAWQVFCLAAGDDTAGWDMAGAVAEVRPARG